MTPLDPLARLDFVCFSSTDWDGWWGSRQQIMLRLAQRGHRVLFVEQMAGLEHLWRYPRLRERKLRGWRGELRRTADNLWTISPPPLLPGRYFSRAINRINSWLALRPVRTAIHRLDFGRPILWVYKPEHVDLIGGLDERLFVYHCIDEFTAGTRGRKRRIIAAMDEELAAKAGLVFANSPPTYEKKRHLNPNTCRMASGVDVAHFAQAMDSAVPIHPALIPISKPIVGYIGRINDRLDYPTLEGVAESHPEWSLVFVGDAYPWTMAASPLRRLSSFPNVHFLGRFAHADMPAILEGMDVCLLPYVRDERGLFRSPLKLYEYLAAGKPVVSLDHPEARELGSSLYLADDPAGFAAAISQALAEDSPALAQSRHRVARQHSWDRRVDTIEAVLAQTLKNKP